MTPLRLATILAVVAGVAGGALGLVTAPISASSMLRKLRGDASPVVLELPARVTKLPLASASPAEMNDRVLAVLHTGSPADLMEVLQEVLSDPALPPLVANLYRDALVDRLVKKGAAEDILKSSQFATADRPAIVAAAVKALAEMNPDAAQAVAMKLTPGVEREGALSAFLTVLGEKNPARGLALVDADPQLRAQAGALFASWAKINPNAAMEAAFSRGPEFENAKRSAIYGWTGVNPDAAWKWIAAQPSGRRGLAEESYFDAVVDDDPQRALNEMATKPEFADTFKAQWIGLCIARDTKSATAAVDRLPPGRGRTQLISGLASSLSGEPTEAIAWAKTLLPGERTVAVSNIFQTMGRFDPANALDVADHELTGAERNTALGEVISGWAQKDPDAAFAGMLGKLDHDALLQALPEVFRYEGSLGKDGVEKRFDAIAKLDPATRAAVLRAWGPTGATRGKEGVLDQLAQLAPNDQTAFAEGVMENRVVRDIPQSTMVRLIGMLPPEKQAQFAPRIAETMAQTDLPSTAAFLSQLPETEHGTEKRQAMASVMRDWIYLQPAEATAFVAQLPAGDTRDRMAQVAAQEMQKFDLDGATQAAAAIATPKMRDDLIEQLAHEWVQVDAARGRAAIAPLLQTAEDRTHAAVLFKDQ